MSLFALCFDLIYLILLIFFLSFSGPASGVRLQLMASTIDHRGHTGSKNQGLRSLRAPKPNVAVLARRLVDVWIRGTQIILIIAPGPATEHFKLSR